MVENDVGGGFGARGEFYPEDFLIPFAARHVKRPVKWIEDRHENFLCATQERDQYWTVTIAVDSDGKILGVQGRVLHDSGAFVPWGIIMPYIAAVTVPGPYVIPAYHLETVVVLTNKVPTTVVRGAGRPQAVFAMERLLDRVARELHDTAIQSLISIEMQVDVLRRSSNGRPQTAELDRIQHLLREEVLNLRELMQSMRPVEVGPNQFLDFMAQLVERFRSDTGVDARFVSELEEVSLPASACRELVRVVQEGLVNVRKHSGAKSVYVRFGAQNGLWRLVIDDDGKGFPFSGRLTLGELDGLHRGPTVIKERIRAIGGDLVIESSPGHGSRLEITVPQKGYEFYG